ncbi:hypothetical protein AAVH_27069 [Aphelenchoides avenae]|nr:hypothetical protein AAVH_27069 [Aphelenchus avenae]
MSNDETLRASKVTSVWSAKCLDGNWVPDDGTVPCEKVAEDDVVSGEVEGSQPSSLAESIARRVERFYDKASRPERTFLKRLIKGLDVEESSVGSSLY